MSLNELFKKEVKALNIGIQTFHDSLTQQSVSVINLTWKPIAGGDQELIKIIETLSKDDRILDANKQAVERINNSSPVWVDVLSAKDAINLPSDIILHSGPPLSYSEMSVPMKGAVLAALKFEGLAETEEDVAALVNKNKIKFKPCHDYGCVGPMTGIISSSMPLLCVKNTKYGNMAYSTLNEGAGEVARFGASSTKTISHLNWIKNVLAPSLKKAVITAEGMNLKLIIAQALNMGDELHMRNNASSTLFFKAILPYIIKTNKNHQELSDISKFLSTNNDQFFLNFAMAAMKVSTDVANEISFSTIVTAMARNGVNFGIKISGLGNQWFVEKAPIVEGLYFPGFTSKDANPDIGDSAIMETGGLGGFAIAAGISVLKLLGNSSFSEAMQITENMYQITTDTSQSYFIPNLNFKGVPIGIDLIKVVSTGLTPMINTAIASAKAGGGMIGAGVSRAPMKMFVDALKAFNNKQNNGGK
jgi:hypothetical protein